MTGATSDHSAGESKPAIGRVLQDSSLYLAGNVLSRIVGFFAIPFYAAYLSPAEYGVTELVELSSQTIALALGLQAIGTALSRVYHDQVTAEAERQVVSTALIGTAVFSALVAGLAIAAAPLLSQAVFHTEEWTGLLRGAFAAMFFSELAEVALVYERIRNRARFFLAYSLVSLVANLGLNVLFIAGLGYGVWGFVSSKLIVTGIAVIYLLARVQRDVGWSWRGMYIPAFVRFGAPLIVSGLAYFVVHFSDRFFLTSAVDLAELGRYALAYRFAILISALVGDSFNKSWQVTIYRYANQPGWQAQFALVASYLTFVLFFTGMGVALFAPEVLRIMVPPDYMPHALLLPILVGAYVIREVGDFFAGLLLINKRTLLMGRVALVMAGVNLAANALLIPQYGVFGAAWATAVTWCVYVVTCWIIAHREHRLPVRLGAYVRLVVLTVVIYGAAAGTRAGPVPVQLVANTVWLLLFSGLAFFLFLGRTERRGAFGVVGNGLVWLLRRGPGAARGEGPAVLVIGAPGSMAQALGPLAMALPSDEAANPATSSWALRAGGIAVSWAERVVEGGGIPSGWMMRGHAAAAAQLGAETVLLSAAPPASAHLLALALKQRHGSRWIAELGPARHGVRSRAVDPLVARAVVAQADVVLAEPEAAASLRVEYPEAAGRIHDRPSDGDAPFYLAVLETVRSR